jgi:hypothetical protein
VVRSPAARWTATLTVPCNTDAKVLAMRALLAGLDGRAGTVDVGPVEVRRAPWFVDPLTGGRITYGKGARAAAVNAAFSTNPDTASTLDFRLAFAVPMNAVSLVLQRNRGGFLQPGMMFSVLGRLHMLTALTGLDPGADIGIPQAGRISVEIRPWTRSAYVPDLRVEFGQPKATMRLATDDTGAIELQLSRFGVVTLDLVEAF